MSHSYTNTDTGRLPAEKRLCDIVQLPQGTVTVMYREGDRWFWRDGMSMTFSSPILWRYRIYDDDH